MPRLALIGLDGATFDLILPLINDGRLPTLAYILKQGAWGTLQSTTPPITPTAWTTVFTGKNPGKHGIFDFQEIDPQTYERQPVYTDRHLEKPVWHLLGEAGLRSIILDVPYTYPPQPLNGLMLTGYGTPQTEKTVFTSPGDWQEILPPTLHDQIRVAQPTQNFDRSRAFLNEWRQIMNGRSELLKHLMTQKDWSFFFHVFSITDNLAHIFWTYLEPSHPNYYRPEGPEYREALINAYIQCDQLLEQMMTWAGPDCHLMVMSDHGFGSVYPRQYLFQRLVDGSYLHYQSPGKSGKTGIWLLQLAMRSYNRLPFLREIVKNLRPNKQALLKKGLKKSGLFPGNDVIDFSRSRVFPSDFGLQLWINHQKRFGQGILDEKEAAVVTATLSNYLLADQDNATGKSIIQSIVRGADIYKGDFAWLGPDLIIENRNFYQPGSLTHPKNPQLEGSHTSNGVFLAYGPAFQAVKINHPISLQDLAPTILHLLGQPIPPDMDGRLIKEAINPQFLRQNPVQLSQHPAKLDQTQQNSTLSAAEEAAVKNQLRQLGYID